MSRALRAIGALALALPLGGCIGDALRPVRRTTLKRSQEVPLLVRVESEPPGARVFLAGSGEEVGTTPCDLRLWRLSFEDWALINSQEEASTIGAPPADAEAAYSLHDQRLTTDTLAEAPLRISLRLERDGYLPEVLTREIAAREIPLLRTAPEIRLSCRLTPATDAGGR